MHAGFIDTDMAALVDAPKISPEAVAQQAFDAVEAGEIEVLADERTRFIKASLSRDHELIYPQVQEFWDSITGRQQERLARRLITGRPGPAAGTARRRSTGCAPAGAA